MSETNNELVCEYCRTIFASKKGLDRHQLTAKYCAKIRNIAVSRKFQCPHCDYETCFKTDLNKHVTKCAIKNRDILTEKEMERLREDLMISKGKIEVLEKIVERPSVINNTSQTLNTLNTLNNNTNNTNITFNTMMNHSIQILSPYEELLEQLPKLITKHMTYEKYKRGIDGITSVLVNDILQNKDEKWLVCYEGNKQDFHEKRLGQIEIDQRASHFFNNFLQAFGPKIEEFSKKEFSDAKSDESAENRATERKRIMKRLADPSSLERKKCVKNIADSIYLSKNAIRAHNDRSGGDLILKITDKMRTNFFRKRLSEYYTLKPPISKRIQTEFTLEKFMLGIPGFVEATKNVLISDEKCSITFFGSEFHYRNKDDILPIQINEILKALTDSLYRICDIHADDYLEKFPDEDPQKVALLRSAFRELRTGPNIYGKDEIFPNRQRFADLLAEALTVSDEEIRSDT